MAPHPSELSVDAAAEVSRQARLRLRGTLDLTILRMVCLENGLCKVRISYLPTSVESSLLFLLNDD